MSLRKKGHFNYTSEPKENVVTKIHEERNCHACACASANGCLGSVRALIFTLVCFAVVRRPVRLRGRDLPIERE